MRDLDRTIRPALLLTLGALTTASASAQEHGAAYPADPIDARVWLDRGRDPVVHRGDRVRLYYRTAADAYVAIFHVDTDGNVSLAHPRGPGEDHYVRAGRDYRLVFPRSPYWHVDEAPGVGYYFVVASRRPMDFSRFHYAHGSGGWDLSRVGRRVYRDPYVAMDDYVAALIPAWERVTYSLGFVEYHVGRSYRFPRFLCYDCHGFRPFDAWNPYYYRCRSFRVVIYTDPIYYPVRRYGPRRVVYVRPRFSERPRFAFKERARGAPATPLLRRRAKPVSLEGPGVEVRRAARRAGKVGGVRGPAVRRSEAVETRAGDDRRAVRRQERGTGLRAPSPDGRPSSRGSARRRDEAREGRGRGEGVAAPRRPTSILRGPDPREADRSPDARPGGAGARLRGDEPARVRPPLRPSTSGARPSEGSGSRPSVRPGLRGHSAPDAGPPSGEARAPGTREPGGEAGPARPSLRPRSGGTRPPAARPPSGGSTRPSARSRPAGSRRPSAQPRRGSSGSSRPSLNPRSSGGRPPAARSRGGGDRPPAPRTGRGEGRQPAPAVQSGGQGGRSRPSVRPPSSSDGRGGNGSARRPPPRRRPPDPGG